MRSAESATSLEYQTDYTSNVVAFEHMYDADERNQKADKVLAVLADYFGDIGNLALLDASASTGIMSRRFGERLGHVTGIDIDEAAIANAHESHQGCNLTFHVMDALNMSLESDSFDVVVCNQMYEHVPDAGRLMAEIHRVLKPGGVCYFGATNRLKVIETHYGRLPFLAWLPRPLADRCLRLLGRADRYYERLLTVWGLRKLTRSFEIVDYTARVISDPDQFHATDVIRPGSLQQKVGLMILRLAYWASPGYVWLLRKPVSVPAAGSESGSLVGSEC